MIKMCRYRRNWSHKLHTLIFICKFNRFENIYNLLSINSLLLVRPTLFLWKVLIIQCQSSRLTPSRSWFFQFPAEDNELCKGADVSNTGWSEACWWEMVLDLGYGCACFPTSASLKKHVQASFLMWGSGKGIVLSWVWKDPEPRYQHSPNLDQDAHVLHFHLK